MKRSVRPSDSVKPSVESINEAIKSALHQAETSVIDKTKNVSNISYRHRTGVNPSRPLRWAPTLHLQPPLVRSYETPRCARGGKLDLALQTLKNMRDENSKAPAPNSVCYNVALQGLSREGRWREARQLLSGVASSTRLDYLSYNSVIRACAAAGMMDEVHNLPSGPVKHEWDTLVVTRRCISYLLI